MKRNHPNSTGATAKGRNQGNSRKISHGRVGLCLGLAGFGLALFYFIPKSLAQSRSSSSVGNVVYPKPAQELTTSAPGSPLRLKIPRLKVDAALEYVGFTSQGALGAPSGPTTAGWYDQGPRPGEKGSAVIDGHLDWINGQTAVFANVHRLQKGDDLYIEDDKGVTTTFVVRELRTYGKSENDSNVFISNDGRAHLNLITCQGVWDKASKSYSNRLVVFADKVPE